VIGAAHLLFISGFCGGRLLLTGSVEKVAPLSVSAVLEVILGHAKNGYDR
jgi:hypothetical protein